MADSSNAAASQDRRKFLGMAALTGMTSQVVSAARSAAAPFNQSSAPAPWRALEHVNAGDLRVSYAPTFGATVGAIGGSKIRWQPALDRRTPHRRRARETLPARDGGWTASPIDRARSGSCERRVLG